MKVFPFFCSGMGSAIFKAQKLRESAKNVRCNFVPPKNAWTKKTTSEIFSIEMCP